MEIPITTFSNLTRESMVLIFFHLNNQFSSFKKPQTQSARAVEYTDCISAEG